MKNTQVKERRKRVSKPRVKKVVKAKTDVVAEIKRNMANDLLYFYQMLFDVKLEKLTPELLKSVNTIYQLVDSCEKHQVLDYDLYVTVNYRMGKKRNPKSVMEEQPPKRMVDVLNDGFDIPSDVSLIELSVNPAMFDNGKMKLVNEPVYETRMAIGKEERLTPEQLMRRYGIYPNEKLLSVEDLSENRILRFYDHNINHEL